MNAPDFRTAERIARLLEHSVPEPERGREIDAILRDDDDAELLIESAAVLGELEAQDRARGILPPEREPPRGGPTARVIPITAAPSLKRRPMDRETLLRIVAVSLTILAAIVCSVWLWHQRSR